MKKRVQVFAVGSLIFWTAFFAGGTSQAKMIVGLSSVNVAFLPVYVTEEKGFFKDEEIALILGGNYLRVLKTILPEQSVI